MVIAAGWLSRWFLVRGEAIVSGGVEPDTYVVDKENLQISSVRVGRQSYEIVAQKAGGDAKVDVSRAKGAHRVLADSIVLELARLALHVEEHYGNPQDIEFALDGGKA